MPRAINSYMKPADIVQQYEYYNYPVAQLIELVKHKDAQQVKAIDAIGAYDDELGKYENLPGDEQVKSGIIQKYTTLKSNTINQDLTGRKGHQVLFKFKDDLRTSILPELQKIDKSAKLWKEDYTREAKKFGEGKSLNFTLLRLNDIAQNHNTLEKGVYTPTSRGEFMDFAAYVKEKNPKLLDGSWDPGTVNLDYKKIFDSGYDQQFAKLATKSISAADLMLAGKDYINYLRTAGFEEDIDYAYKKSATPEQAATIGKEMHINVQLTNLQKNAQDFIDNRKKVTPEIKNKTAKELGVDIQVINNLLSDDEDIRKAAYKQIEEIHSKKLSEKYDELSPEQQIENGYKALTSNFYGTLTQPFIEQYAGDITDFKIDKFDTENYIFKKQYELALKKKEIDYAQSVQEATQNYYLQADAINMSAETFQKNLTSALNTRTTSQEIVNKLSNKQNLTDSEKQDLALAQKNLEETSWVTEYTDTEINITDVDGRQKLAVWTAIDEGYNSIQKKVHANGEPGEKTNMTYYSLNKLWREGRLTTETLKNNLRFLPKSTQEKINKILPEIYSAQTKKNNDGTVTIASYSRKLNRETKQAKHFISNLSSVMDGDALKILTEEEKKQAEILTNGKIKIGNNVYDLKENDKNNLDATLSQIQIAMAGEDMDAYQAEAYDEQHYKTDPSPYGVIWRGATNSIRNAMSDGKTKFFESGTTKFRVVPESSQFGNKYYYIESQDGNNWKRINKLPLQRDADVTNFVNSIPREPQ
jgi:hypothetical protein